MSTRCNVVVTDGYGQALWFYRHSDGYPSGAGESLKIFMQWLWERRIRDAASQASGWLVVLGHTLYEVPDVPALPEAKPGREGPDWKVGAFEPTSDCHGDVEYVYVIDLARQELRCHRPGMRKVTGENSRHACFNPKNPPKPFWTVTKANVDEAIIEEV